MQTRIFISFASSTGFGNAILEIGVKTKVRSMDDIMTLEAEIRKKSGLDKVVILHWKDITE